MRLAIVNITGGNLSGGYAKYLHRMVPLLCEDPRIHDVSVFLPEGAKLPAGDGPRVLSGQPVFRFSGLRDLKSLLCRVKPEVIFIPTARWVNTDETPTVVMVRNMEPLTVPFQGNSPAEAIRNLVRAYLCRQSCVRADRIIAVSEHVCQFLISRWKIPADKIGQVYHGVEPPPDPEHVLIPRSFAGHSPRPFVFTAGSIRPARGLEDLIMAMPRLCDNASDVAAVIAGGTDPRSSGHMLRLRRLAKDLGVAPRLVWVGHLAPLEMSWCFYHCASFVVTSRAEACPNTTLEAMSHGCEIVSTRSCPMPEFLGDTALYYDPYDAGDLAGKLSAAMERPVGERERLRVLRQERARQYQWKVTADRTVEQLMLAMASGTMGEIRVTHR